MGSKDAMEVGDRKARDSSQSPPVERLAEVSADVAHHTFDASRRFVKDGNLGQHIQTIVYQNTCSLFRTYHPKDIHIFEMKLFQAGRIKVFVTEEFPL